MEIFAREYRPEDDSQLPEIFRNASNSLRESRGGKHPDKTIDELIGQPDEQILNRLKFGKFLMVAEVRESGELAGMGAFSRMWKNDFFKTSYSTGHYVKEEFQRGRAGVSVGSMLRLAIMKKAKELGYRKLYGFSTPEAIGFHKKFGARFFPRYNKINYGVQVHYYEIELNRSIINGIRFEPLLFELSPVSHAYVSFLRMLGK